MSVLDFFSHLFAILQSYFRGLVSIPLCRLNSFNFLRIHLFSLNSFMLLDSSIIFFWLSADVMQHNSREGKIKVLHEDFVLWMAKSLLFIIMNVEMNIFTRTLL